MRRLSRLVASIATLTLATLFPLHAALAQMLTTLTTTGNLIVDGSANAGYCTTDWTAATTMPGWTVNASSPDVICSSAGSFSWPGSAPGAFFAPGDQGDGTMTQTINVAAASSAINAGYDGESSGNGSATSLRVQDGWLKQTITPIMQSPAWTTQKSLLILTWDESDYQQPDNHIAAIMAGSQGTVNAGYVSNVRHDDYSIGSTIEHALGIGSFTANDEYGQPVNEAFSGQGANVPSALAVDAQNGSSVTFGYSTEDSLEASTNWIGVYPAGDIPDQVSSTQWQYTPGPDGSVTFTGLAAGTYYAYYLYDNGYIAMAGPVSFTVS